MSVSVQMNRLRIISDFFNLSCEAGELKCQRENREQSNKLPVQIENEDKIISILVGNFPI